MHSMCYKIQVNVLHGLHSALHISDSSARVRPFVQLKKRHTCMDASSESVLASQMDSTNQMSLICSDRRYIKAGILERAHTHPLCAKDPVTAALRQV